MENMPMFASNTPANVQSGLVLNGVRVAIPRAADEANSPSEWLRKLGAQVVYYPCMSAMPPANLDELDKALQAAATGQFDWLVLTTANTVFAVAARLEALNITPSALVGMKVAMLGANTRLAAKNALGVDVDRAPETYLPEELVAAMAVKAGERILLPQPDQARPTLRRLLTATGAALTPLVAYCDRLAQGGDEVPVMLWEGQVDAITFTSEANVRYFAKRLQYEGGTLAMLDDVCVACIEPITAAAAQSYGLHVDVVPQEHTPEGLATALADYFGSHARGRMH
jgi:uroporphyrinogen-III synthase